MKIGEFCSAVVIAVRPQASLREAALLMRKMHVGSLVATDGDNRPVGVITDRDIVIALAAMPDSRLDDLKVSEVMTSRLTIVREDQDVFEAARAMGERGVRRLPVVAANGTLRGIVTADDLHRVVSKEMASLATALRDGPRREDLDQRLEILLRRMPVQ